MDDSGVVEGAGHHTLVAGAARRRVVAALLAVGAAAVLGLAVAGVVTDGLDRPGVAAALAGALAGANIVPLVSISGGRVSAFTPVGALLVPIGLLLPAGEAVLTYALGETLGVLVSHRMEVEVEAPEEQAGVRTLMTLSKSILGGALGVLVMQHLTAPGTDVLRVASASAAGVLVSSAFDHVVLAVATSIIRGVGLVAELVRDLADLAVIGLGEAVTGAVITILALRDPWSLVLGLGVFGLLVLASATSARARTEHGRSQSLLELAQQLEGAEGVDAVLDTLLDAMRELFPQDEVAVVDAPVDQSHHSWLIDVPYAGHRWLTMRRIVDARDYEEQPVDVVDAAVSMAHVAIVRAAAQEQLLEQDQLRSLVLSTVAHDLRTPLSAASGALDTLARRWDGLADERRDALLAMGRRSVQRAARLVDDVLSLERPVAEEPATEVLDVGTLVRRVLIEVDLGDIALVGRTERAFASVDRVAVERAVENLVMNAAKYSPAGGTVRVSCEPAGSDGVEVVVTDEGPGVPLAQRTAIFEAFEQGSESRGGFGLGLFVAHQLTVRYGGRIWVDDAPGGGAQFHLWYPTSKSTDGPEGR